MRPAEYRPQRTFMSLVRLLRKPIKGLADKFGLEVVRSRKSNYRLDLYERLYEKSVLDGKPFYNIGAGSFWHPYWTNIDYISDWYSGVQKDVKHYDLTALEPLPIDSLTAEIIYTSHTIEHVKEASVQNLFKEAWRALKPGGILRVTTGPDAETDFRALMRGDADWYYWDEDYIAPGTYEHMYHAPATSVPLEERWLNHFASQLAPNDKSPSERKYSAEEIRQILANKGFKEALEFFAGQCHYNPERPGNHISWWSHEKVMSFIREAGFSEIYRSGYGQSVSPVMRNSMQFDTTHPQMSIYVEAIK
jgi:SAM-dependent methyltransferase